MQKKVGFLALVSIIFFLSGNAFGERKGVELGLGLNRFLFGDDIGLSDDMGFRGHIGYRFEGPWGLEFSYNQTATEIEFSGADLDVSHAYVDVLYHFNSGGGVEPYLALGYGNADAEVVDGDTYDIGAGLKFYVTDGFVIRPDLHYGDVSEFGDTHMIASLNISWLFGKPVKAVAPIVESKPAPRDSDKDGVMDSADNCPSTPMGAGVDAYGCPLDSDGDGVYDYQDKCPGTSARLKVDAQGCPVVLKDSVSINLKVNFASNSDVVAPEYFPEIRRVAEFLEQYENTVAVIEGHTDTSGAAAYNKSLSQRRAAAVAKVLVEQMSVDSASVSAVGYGEERPIADESTREGRLANRRVVAEITTVVEKMEEK